jgi:hypothetical protein
LPSVIADADGDRRADTTRLADGIGGDRSLLANCGGRTSTTGLAERSLSEDAATEACR